MSLQWDITKKDDWILLTFIDDDWEQRQQFFNYELAESQFFKMEVFIEEYKKEIENKKFVSGTKKMTDKQKKNRDKINDEMKKKFNNEFWANIESMKLWREWFMMHLAKEKIERMDLFDKNYFELMDKYRNLLKSKSNKDD